MLNPLRVERRSHSASFHEPGQNSRHVIHESSVHHGRQLCATRTHEGIGQYVDDAVITSKVKAAIPGGRAAHHDRMALDTVTVAAMSTAQLRLRTDRSAVIDHPCSVAYVR